MIPYERRTQILAILQKEKTATMKTLANALYVSEASVRRDVEELQKEGLCEKVYGGVILAEYKNSVVPLSRRDADHSDAKELLARRAAAFAFDGATIMMDASSTTRRIIPHLAQYHHLTIVTNNSLIVTEAEEKLPTARIYLTGGLFLAENHVFVGPQAERFLREMNADICYFSSQGISEEGVISDPSEEETAVRKVMIQQAQKKVFLADASKVGKVYPFVVCRGEEVEEMVVESQTK